MVLGCARRNNPRPPTQALAAFILKELCLAALARSTISSQGCVHPCTPFAQEPLLLAAIQKILPTKLQNSCRCGKGAETSTENDKAQRGNALHKIRSWQFALTDPSPRLRLLTSTTPQAIYRRPKVKTIITFLSNGCSFKPT